MRAARFLIPFLAIAALACPKFAASHGDNELPLFVAPNGSDTGDCLDAEAPCASIGYALSRAGKGGQILVAEGSYDIEEAEDVFHLVSGVVQVSGGYRKADSAPSAVRGTSLLTGVPFQYRQQLEAQGFQVVADAKGVAREKAIEASKLLSLHQRLKTSIDATPCAGGTAAGLPCDQVDLLSHVGLLDVSATPTAGNDIWGFVDLNTGREYAIVGYSLGTAVFDVTDATNPREVGFIDGQSATWRDIKVYQYFDNAAARWRAYAYVTTDGSTDGLFVIDMTRLPHSISRASYASDITRAHNIYATNTDYGTGISLTGDTPTLIIAGSDLGADNGRGKFRNYALDNPRSPAFISGGMGTGYMHDASSIIITDSRKDTQCVNGSDYCEVLLDFNEDQIELWDITIPSNPVLLNTGGTTYSNVGYVHSGWWSEDKQTVFVHDELDERNSGLRTTLRAFSVADLRNPVLSGTWTGPTGAIDHNGFVRGNRYYMSNYTRGLSVLDISAPSAPVAVGRLDTYPASDGTMFNGAWGAYPYFWSGNIAISDIDSGFYMAADQTRDVPEGTLAFVDSSYPGVEGQQAQLTVQRTGGASGAVSVDYEILHATGDAVDYNAVTGRLSWADGDGSSRTININVINDGANEGMERLIVRLVDPTGGATLGNLSTTNVYLSDPGAAAELNFLDARVDVSERGFATAVGVIQRTGSAAGAVSVDIGSLGNVDGSDIVGNIPATVSWADGDANPKLIEFGIVDDGVTENTESITLTLTNPGGATAGPRNSFQVFIQDGSGSNTAPNAIAGASQARPSGSQVSLDGSLSSDPDGDGLTYAWTQTSGSAVTLNGANAAVASFTAPTVSSDTLLQFQLTVVDSGGLSDFATTTVTVTRSGGQASSGGGSGATGLLALLILGSLAARRRFSRMGGS